MGGISEVERHGWLLATDDVVLRSDSTVSEAVERLHRAIALDPSFAAAHAALATFTTDGFGYFQEQLTRPQTIGYSLLDSPVGLGAWMLDHDTDSYYKISRAFVDGEPAGNLTRDQILDNITLYWLTGTGASAARWYWETGRAQAAADGPPPPVAVPVAFTTFPGEIFPAPRSWVETAYPGLAYFNEVDRGGHFAAWEEPQLFSEEIRAAFRSLR
jgi:pimeloyl-ACP methyl ester carboxylesterase